MMRKISWSKLFVFLLLSTFTLAAFIWWNFVPRNPKNNLEIILNSDSDRLVFYLLGDTGSGNEFQYRVAQAMNQQCLQDKKIDGVFLLGDNFYQEGVASQNDPQWQTKYLQPYLAECLNQSPFYAILGNHDYKGNIQAQVDMHGKNNWVMPHRFYSVTFQNLVRFVMMDSNMPDFCLQKNNCTLDFLDDQLQQTFSGKTIVLAHHPLYSSSKKHGHANFLYRKALEKMLCHRAQYYISGHAHLIEHYDPKICGLQLFISGGGGGDLYDFDQVEKYSKFVKKEHGFLRLEVRKEKIIFTFINHQGEILYTYD